MEHTPVTGSGRGRKRKNADGVATPTPRSKEAKVCKGGSKQAVM